MTVFFHSRIFFPFARKTSNIKKRVVAVFSFCFFSTVLFANTWQQKPSCGGIGRHRGTGISIGNKGYMGLGHLNGTGVDVSYKDWWEYDPASNSWTQKANFPVAVHGATAFGTATHGYVGGGSSLTNQFYAFHPQSNTWTPIANCPFNPGDTQGFSVKNKGYVYIGNQLAEYNPVQDSWELKAVAPFNFANWSCSFATESSGFIKSGNKLVEYKPSSNQWILRANFPGLMTNGGAGFSIDGKGYVACGFSGPLSAVTDEVWEFNPGNNTWSTVSEFPGSPRRFHVAFAIHNRGYLGGGTDGTNFNDFWQFFDNSMALQPTISIQDQLQVYPNPAIESLTFDFQSIDPSLWMACELRIFSATGHVISQQKITSHVMGINRNSLPAGIYYYTIQNAFNVVAKGKLIYL